MSFPISGVSYMIKKALSTMDYRLVDHGERVTYLVLRMLQEENRFTTAQLKEMCYLSMFHDIGAYRTELIDSLLSDARLFKFEVNESLNHSIYSYLFLRNFSFFQEFSDAILFHHFPYPKLFESDCKNKFLASKIFIADRLDVMISKKIVTSVEDLFKVLSNPVFNQDDVLLLKRAHEHDQFLNGVFGSDCFIALHKFLNTKDLSDDELASIVEMLPYAIDFRSVTTLTHTVATVEITLAIAELLELPQKEMIKLYYGSLLHDIGKIATSLLILEKPDKLSDFEFTIMKDHVLLSEYILKRRVTDEVLKIATRHHEKIDGSGYPYGIKGDDLSQNERIVAVADILSALIGRRSYKDPFPQEKIASILNSMVSENKLCSVVVGVVLENYDALAQGVLECNNKAVLRYEKMQADFDRLYSKYSVTPDDF